MDVVARTVWYEGVGGWHCDRRTSYDLVASQIMLSCEVRKEENRERYWG